MTFEELSSAPPDYRQWYVTVGYLDDVWCRQRADDSCEAPSLPVAVALPVAPATPVSEPGAALMLACGLVGMALLRRMRR